MAMKAAPNDGHLQAVSEKLLALVEVSSALELGEYLEPEIQTAIIHEMDKIEEIEGEVEALLAKAGPPPARARKRICEIFEEVDAALRPILEGLTVGWDQI